MTAKLYTCPECGTQFYAIASAIYCTTRCRSRAYYRRTGKARRAAK
jgi:hypothetical protein